MKPRLRVLMAVGAVLAAIGISTASAAPASAVLPVPFRTQLDGTVWASSNCGPAAISMVLQAFDQKIPTQTLRDRANQLLGIASPNTGTRVQDLAQVVRERGLSVNGPYASPGKIRQWTLDDVRAELLVGRPMVVETYYPLLPNHMNNPVDTDHYIVIVGFSGDNFIFNDSAASQADGYHQTMTSAQFLRAWGASQIHYGGFSVGPASGGQSLLPPPPATPEPTAAPAPATATAPVATSTPSGAAAPTATPAPSNTPSTQPAQGNSTPAPTAAPASPAPSQPTTAAPATSQGTGSKPSTTATPGPSAGKDNGAAAPATPATPADQPRQQASAAPANRSPLANLSGFVDRIKANVQSASK